MPTALSDIFTPPSSQSITLNKVPLAVPMPVDSQYDDIALFHDKAERATVSQSNEVLLMMIADNLMIWFQTRMWQKICC
jgi:hypothetical protein